MKIEHYEIASSTSLSNLNALVRSMIRDGYQPWGSLCVDSNALAPSEYAQAMVKYADEEPCANS